MATKPLYITDTEALLIKRSLQRELAHHYRQEHESQKDDVPHLAAQHRAEINKVSRLLDILNPTLSYL